MSSYYNQNDLYRFTQFSIMSLDICLIRLSRCLANSSSGQCRSLIKVCRASSFQNKSSDDPEPLLKGTNTGQTSRVRADTHTHPRTHTQSTHGDAEGQIGSIIVQHIWVCMLYFDQMLTESWLEVLQDMFSSLVF